VASVRLTPRAELEYEEALVWYQGRSPRAADGFEAAFAAALAKVAAAPQSYPLHDDELRFATLKRYPYSLIFRMKDEEVQVVAVAHHHRGPGYWSRLGR
jgi:plasmid stabilization system protein ParE